MCRKFFLSIVGVSLLWCGGAFAADHGIQLSPVEIQPRTEVVDLGEVEITPRSFVVVPSVRVQDSAPAAQTAPRSVYPVQQLMVPVEPPREQFRLKIKRVGLLGRMLGRRRGNCSSSSCSTSYSSSSRSSLYSTAPRAGRYGVQQRTAPGIRHVPSAPVTPPPAPTPIPRQQKRLSFEMLLEIERAAAGRRSVEL